jgi:hypothetical protein
LVYNLQEMAEAPHSSHPGERPWSVTLVAWGVSLLGIINGWRAVTIFRQRWLLLDLGVTLDPAVTAAAAAVWSLLFVAAAVAIYRRYPVSRWLTPVLLAAHTLIGIALTGIWRATPDASGGLTLTLLFSTAVFVFVIWARNRKAARDYFVTEQK